MAAHVKNKSFRCKAFQEALAIKDGMKSTLRVNNFIQGMVNVIQGIEYCQNDCLNLKDSHAHHIIVRITG